MKDTIIAVAVLGFLLGIAYAAYSHMAAPSTYERAPEEPELCLVDTMTDGSVFTDYGGKSLLVIKPDATVDIYEEARDDRSNCVEQYEIRKNKP